MLNKSKKAKGKRLENEVADALKEFDQYAYRRADSGSGLHRKEDVFTTLPFFIECKNQEEINITSWWKQTLEGCPANKFPILIYKKNFQRDPLVYMKLSDLISFMADKRVETFKITITMVFEDFISLLREKYGKNSGVRL